MVDDDPIVRAMVAVALADEMPIYSEALQFALRLHNAKG